MPTVRASIHLPYQLTLSPGEYPTPNIGGSLRLAKGSRANAEGTLESRSEASVLFDVTDHLDAVAQERQRGTEADRLLRRVNHLLRWYRVATGQATIIELTRAQASPFRFVIDGTAVPWGGEAPLEYEAPAPPPAGNTVAAVDHAVRAGLGSQSDPDVASMNLLDAEHALSVGRFREAVLLCWGAIDSTFVRQFKRLVDQQLGDEWPEGRDFLKGFDFGLRHKMTTGLRLLAGRSLYAEPDGFWQDLSDSYRTRNGIIHDGQIAHEDDAQLAIKVGRRLVQIVGSLAGP